MTFNGVIVANKRQLDLFRGSLAPFFDPRIQAYFHNSLRLRCLRGFRQGTGKGAVGGNWPVGNFKRMIFLVGWLGGVYGWFDLDSVMRGVSGAIVENRNIKIIFFGADEFRQAELLRSVGEEAWANVVFMPWVEFFQALRILGGTRCFSGVGSRGL
ncbi:hypothetical protein ACFS3C_07815 [Azotobacter vinelandii]